MSMVDPVVPTITPPVVAADVLERGGLAAGMNNTEVAELAIQAATAMVYDYCERSFESSLVEETRSFQVLDDEQPLVVDGYRTAASVEVISPDGATTWTHGVEIAADAPLAGSASRTVVATGERTWEEMRNDDGWISVKAIYGWSDAPAGVKLAITMTAQRLIVRQASKSGILGFADFNYGDYGGEARYLGGQLDGDIERLLAPYSLRGKTYA